MWRFTVVMATYNGAHLLGDQIDSIMRNLSEDDRLVIVDDGSSDGTVEKLHQILEPRVSVHAFTENVGHVRNFERGLALVENSRYIALSDQDDSWPDGRLLTMKRLLDDSVMTAGSAESISGPGGHPFAFVDARRNSHLGRSLNLMGLLRGTMPYYGSAMAFRASLLGIALPFPQGVEAHDHWLAICGNVAGPVRHTSQVVVNRREHGANLTNSARPLAAKIMTRVAIIRLLREALRRRASNASR